MTSTGPSANCRNKKQNGDNMIEQRIRILLVEDDKVDQMVVERLVRDKGLPYDLKTALSVTEGIEQINKFKFDVILLDYQLGDGTGMDLLKEIKDTPVIFVTGSGSEEIAVQAMRDGAYDYLIKDPDRNYLIVLPSTVQNVLARKRVEEERAKLIKELQGALAKIKTLSGFLPICSSCKKIRDDTGYWNQIEAYIQDHSEAEFTHSLCPECMKKLYPDLYGK